jgi:hypothetical protein
MSPICVAFFIECVAMTTLKRTQRGRAKGWKMPPNTVGVAPPSKWRNPYWIINEVGLPWITDARDKSMPVSNYEADAL